MRNASSSSSFRVGNDEDKEDGEGDEEEKEAEEEEDEEEGGDEFNEEKDSMFDPDKKLEIPEKTFVKKK